MFITRVQLSAWPSSGGLSTRGLERMRDHFSPAQKSGREPNRSSSDGETKIAKCQILRWACCKRLWNGTRPRKFHRYTSSNIPAKVGYSPNPCSLLIRPESWQLATASKSRTAALDLRSQHRAKDSARFLSGRLYKFLPSKIGLPADWAIQRSSEVDAMG